MLTVQSPASLHLLAPCLVSVSTSSASLLFPSPDLAQRPAGGWLLFILLLVLTTFLTLQSLNSAFAPLYLFLLPCFILSLSSFSSPHPPLPIHLIPPVSSFCLIVSSFRLTCHHTLIPPPPPPRLLSCTSPPFFHPLIPCFSPPLPRLAPYSLRAQ